MNTINTKTLAAFIETVKQTAKEDTPVSVIWFCDTEDAPFSIIAGWQKMFVDDKFADVFCCSKREPEYVMCVKIAKNGLRDPNTDFDSMDMPFDQYGNVDDTCVPLEWDDHPECAAEFFAHEWERIMKEHKEEI